ncbi:hypothetical protein Dalk_2892 [Desulfatibacillum aliphaticivorans]|uniref:Lipoprotein n=1 Tax=Desulfatibacillum aliphaticivorans TaxID=218208 RepID=B8FBD8_DESAL|nr:hypothetical protein [Desulfatibacillum aliphaticivorans]ACL04582.1 hypothetical protein Dalk_2892 [Desulfatibacillum aliphaticivorans]
MMMNRMSVALMVLFGMLCVTSCMPRNDRVLPNGLHWPKHPKFSVSPKLIGDSSPLDFDAVYCNITEYKEPELDPTYDWFRFWANGRVLTKSSSRSPTPDFVEDLSSGNIGYYEVNGLTIIIETFVPDSGVLNWSYFRMEGTIEGDEIVFYRSEMRKEIHEYRTVY